MKDLKNYDCIVIGSGPNGLSAAITLQAAGLQTHIIEKIPVYGGGLKSDEALGPGYIRDVCSAIFPLAALSPFFRGLDISFEWLFPEIPCAHPLADGNAVALYTSIEETASQFSKIGCRRYRNFFSELMANAYSLADDIFRPILHIPKHPWHLARFAGRGIWPANFIANYLRDDKAKALFAGMAAHSFLPFDRFLSGAAGIVLMLAGHKEGWPVMRGGSGQIARVLMTKFLQLGGTIELGVELKDIKTLPSNCALFFDTSPRTLAGLARDFLPKSYLEKILRYRYGPAAYKIDFLLSEAIPWNAEICRRAGTVHLGGSFADIKKSEELIGKNQLSPSPFIVVAQQSLFDRSRSHDHKEIVWSYAHAPHGSKENISELIEQKIEQHAEGFKDCIIAKTITAPQDLEDNNPNLVGGDIIGGVADMGQTLARPILSAHPYRTPNPRIFLCSASTPPGAGVHGMCGWWAAQTFINTRVQ